MQEKNQKNIHNKSEHTFASFCTQMYSLQITKNYSIYLIQVIENQDRVE